MSQETRIRCFVDFEKDGRQISHLQLPYSSNVSAYGWIGIPIAVIRNGRGPTLYLGAGNHGDEYEGQIVLARLIRELDPGALQGRAVGLQQEALGRQQHDALERAVEHGVQAPLAGPQRLLHAVARGDVPEAPEEQRPVPPL